MSMQVNLDELERITNAATPGPWSEDHNGTPDSPDDWYGAAILGALKLHPGGAITACNLIQVDSIPADARFIAEARTAVPALIAELREARATIERVHALHEAEEGMTANWCRFCGDFDGPWPCSTIQALNEGNEE